jgi:hypothetical protein
MARQHPMPGIRRSLVTVLVGSLAVVLVLAACQGRTGTIDAQDSSGTSAESTAPAESARTPSGFATELPQGICPDLETIAAEQLGPVEYTLDEVVEDGTDGVETQRRCDYGVGGGEEMVVMGSEGILLADLDVSIYEPGTTVPEFAVPDPINFEEHPAAGYFGDWDQTTLYLEIEHAEGPFSNCVNLLVTAAIDNITVTSGVALFYTGEDTDAEVAAFQIVVDLTDALLEALPRN